MDPRLLKRQCDRTPSALAEPEEEEEEEEEVTSAHPDRGAQTTCFLYGAPKNHDSYGLSIFCMDQHQ
jgi:hypothetical protein